ncbi:MAG: hypothetical protein ACLFQK_01690 [Fibrobacterota bacterium]
MKKLFIIFFALASVVKAVPLSPFSLAGGSAADYLSGNIVWRMHLNADTLWITSSGGVSATVLEAGKKEGIKWDNFFISDHFSDINWISSVYSGFGRTYAQGYYVKEGIETSEFSGGKIYLFDPESRKWVVDGPGTWRDGYDILKVPTDITAAVSGGDTLFYSACLYGSVLRKNISAGENWRVMIMNNSLFKSYGSDTLEAAESFDSVLTSVYLDTSISDDSVSVLVDSLFENRVELFNDLPVEETFRVSEFSPLSFDPEGMPNPGLHHFPREIEAVTTGVGMSILYAGTYAGLKYTPDGGGHWRTIMASGPSADRRDSSLGDFFANSGFKPASGEGLTGDNWSDIKFQNYTTPGGQDRQNLWGIVRAAEESDTLIKTVQTGAVVLSTDSSRTFRRMNSLSDNISSDIYDMDFLGDTVFLATLGEGIYMYYPVYDTAADTVKKYILRGIPRDNMYTANIYSVKVWDYGSGFLLFAGTDDGLYVTEGREGKWSNYRFKRELKAGSLRETYVYPTILDKEVNTGFVRFAYSLQKDAGVTITIYNFAGERVRRIIDNEKRFAARRSEKENVDVWDGLDDDGRRAAVGVYYYRIETDKGDKDFGKIILKR